MSDETGCFTLAGAYCLGSYMFVAIGLDSSGPNCLHLSAPATVPFFLMMGFIMFQGSLHWVGTDLTLVAMCLLMWGSLIVAAHGLITSYAEWYLKKWPVVLTVVTYAVAFGYLY